MRIAPPSGEQWLLDAHGYRAVAVAVGGGLRAFDVGDWSVVDGYPVDEIAPGCAGQVLAPWPNRIRDGRYTFDGAPQQLALTEPDLHNAIHGLARWVTWRAVASDPAELTLEYVVPAQVGYPWTVRLTTTWALVEDGLRATHTATNLTDRPCPFGLGVHPYLMLPDTPLDGYTVTMPAHSRLLVDARRLPIGAAKVAGTEYDFSAGRRIGGAELDTAFGGVPDGGSSVLVSGVDGGARIEIWADGNFHWWQLYTGHTLPAPRTRRSLAVEPMTCPPDAYHSGRDLITLAPGQTWQGSWGIRPTRAAEG